MKKKVLIVGGVAGGASTAARLRRLDESIEIVMFEKGGYISFANCGLPYYIGGSIKERASLLVQTPKDMNEKFNIDVRVYNEVTKINRDEKTVEVLNVKTNEKYTESYDTLVLSPGSMPLKPPIKGIDSPNVFSLWNVPDVDRIKGYCDEYKPKKAVVVGGGFIGMEMAENLFDLGMKVSVVDMMDQVMSTLDYEMAQILHSQMNNLGVDLYLKEAVEAFEYEEEKQKTNVCLKSGTKIEADIVIFSIGVRPQSQIAKEAGLELNERGGIVVNEHLKTSDENIFALGDVIEVTEFVNKGKTMIPLAGPANKQGRICADNITGKKSVFKGSQGTSVARIFQMSVASTGLNEKQLQKMGKEYGKDYFVSLVMPKGHAGYYPGAMGMTLKVIFEKNGRILGAQNVGFSGVDKRIDVIATSIRYNGTIYDLMEDELAYAPPYSSAKDPVNMAGFVAENILLGKVKPVLVSEIAEAVKEPDTVILDVRDDFEVIIGQIEGSVQIPLNNLRERMDELDKSKKYIIYCAIGTRGYIAARLLMQNGFDEVYNLLGGFTHYKSFHHVPGIAEEIFVPKQEEDDIPMEIGDEVIMEGKTIEVDACGLQCPGPIMSVHKAIENAEVGDTVKVKATDIGFYKDIVVWCERTNNSLIKCDNNGQEINALIRKGNQKVSRAPEQNSGTAMVVFSGDLDKALAALIIANGAASMGQEVTLFFTFWGLNILRKKEKVDVNKDFIAGMFGKMMPRGTDKLGLSQMNMMGMGPKMIKNIMKKKNVSSLDELLHSAMENGVKLVACNMSMDLMGITAEELIDGVEFGGVGAFVGAADKSNINMFI